MWLIPDGWVRIWKEFSLRPPVLELHPLKVFSFHFEAVFRLKSALNTTPFNSEISHLVKNCLPFSFSNPWFWIFHQPTPAGFIPQSLHAKRNRLKTETFPFRMQGSGYKSCWGRLMKNLYHGLLKLNGRQFFTKFELSKLKGGVWRADFRRKNAAKWKLATLRGTSSKTGGLRENSFQILTHLSGVSHVSYLVKTQILSL